MMKVPAAHPQPFSKPLREIARIIVERESDEACVARISSIWTPGASPPAARRKRDCKNRMQGVKFLYPVFASPETLCKEQNFIYYRITALLC